MFVVIEQIMWKFLQNLKRPLNSQNKSSKRNWRLTLLDVKNAEIIWDVV